MRLSCHPDIILIQALKVCASLGKEVAVSNQVVKINAEIHRPILMMISAVLETN